MPLLPAVVDVRRAVQAAVDAHSLRGVAAAIGMSAPGLQNFLDGGVPRVPTWRKLTAWYVGRFPDVRGHIPPEAARAALALLVDGLPREARPDARRELLAVIERRYALFRMGPPPWSVDTS